MSLRTITKEQESTIYGYVDVLISEGRVRNQGKSARIFRITNGNGNDVEVRGALKLGDRMKQLKPALAGITAKTLDWYIGKRLRKHFGALHRRSIPRKRSAAFLSDRDLARLELKTRERQRKNKIKGMTDAELVALARGR